MIHKVDLEELDSFIDAQNLNFFLRKDFDTKTKMNRLRNIFIEPFLNYKEELDCL